MSEIVALTGATGFIGRALLDHFRENTIPVRALCRRPQTNSDSVNWIEGDLSNKTALNTLLDGASVLIHCAGVVRGKSLEDFTEVNTLGTRNLLDTVRQQSGHPRILFISSLAARQPELSWYAQSKHQAESLFHTSQDINWSIFRPTAVYGPGDTEIQPLMRLLRRGLLPAPATGSNFTLLHVHDLVSAVALWLNNSSVNGNTYELDDGSPSGYNWDILTKLANEIWGRSVLRVSVPLPVLGAVSKINLTAARLLNYAPMLTPAKIREITHPDWSCDTSGICRDLGWEAEIKLVDAMQELSLLGI